MFGVDSLWLLSFFSSPCCWVRRPRSPFSVGFCCLVYCLLQLYVLWRLQVILILVIVMEGEDAIVVAAAGGRVIVLADLIERASHMCDINTYFMILDVKNE